MQSNQGEHFSRTADAAGGGQPIGRTAEFDVGPAYRQIVKGDVAGRRVVRLRGGARRRFGTHRDGTVAARLGRPRSACLFETACTRRPDRPA